MEWRLYTSFQSGNTIQGIIELLKRFRNVGHAIFFILNFFLLENDGRKRISVSKTAKVRHYKCFIGFLTKETRWTSQTHAFCITSCILWLHRLLDEWIIDMEGIPFWSFFFCFVFLCVRRVAWKHRCQGNTDSYIADCNTSSSDDGSSSSPSLGNDSSGADRERKPQLAAQPENPQQPNNWLWFPFSHAFPTGWLFFWAQQNRK